MHDAGAIISFALQHGHGAHEMPFSNHMWCRFPTGKSKPNSFARCTSGSTKVARCRPTTTVLPIGHCQTTPPDPAPASYY